MTQLNEAGLTEGHIYSWRYRDEGTGQFTYWCKSRIAIVVNGRLFDTFWSSPNREYELDPQKVELTFFADSSWQTIKPYEKPYYADEDVADTRHSNDRGAPIYLRPGAAKNATAILEDIEHQERDARSAIQSAQWKLDRMTEARKLLAEGKINEVWL